MPLPPLNTEAGAAGRARSTRPYIGSGRDHRGRDDRRGAADRGQRHRRRRPLQRRRRRSMPDEFLKENPRGRRPSSSPASPRRCSYIETHEPRRGARGLRRRGCEEHGYADYVEAVETNWAGSTGVAPRRTAVDLATSDISIWLDWLGDPRRRRPVEDLARRTSTPTSSTTSPRRADHECTHRARRACGQIFLVRGDDDQQLREFVALEDVDLTIEPGEFLTLVGPAGCGKSTILDLVSRPEPAERRRRSASTAQRDHRARPRPQRRLPAVHPAAVAHGAGQHRVRARGEGRAAQGRARRAGAGVPRPGRAQRVRATGYPASSPAA